ncbi:hypothetical protein [Chromatium okenii]|uniref:hypothetical protein n=1 Tax=Chromatium okenii TaxID=61644 RepID=UPI001A9138AD|nr:hypothetical protein [Chromatium okenii]
MRFLIKQKMLFLFDETKEAKMSDDKPLSASAYQHSQAVNFEKSCQLSVKNTVGTDH